MSYFRFQRTTHPHPPPFTRGRWAVIKGWNSPRNTNQRVDYKNLFVGVYVLCSAPLTRKFIHLARFSFETVFNKNITSGK